MSHHRTFLYASCLLFGAVMSVDVALADEPLFHGGHAKYLSIVNTFPDDSLFRDFIDSPAVDNNIDLRLKFRWKSDDIALVTDYQVVAQQGDGIFLRNKLPGAVTLPNAAPSDERRLFDLTHVFTEDDDSVVAHRLDRLYVDITGDKAVIRFGRQVVSWGNGLIYTPMDFFNPFDPATVDKEYKSGDDMVYGQYLTQDGDDLQAVWVIRRNSDGDLSSEVDSIATKYHGFVGNNEYDLLLARHYDDNIFGTGAIVNIGGAVVRGDLTLTDTGNDTVSSLVTNLSYSWVGWGHNISGVIEYFYNGFGQTNGDYSPAALASNPALVERFSRGELFTLARQYIAVSALIEMTPLWTLTPNVFLNINDHSFLTQLISTYDFKQDWQFLAALNLPVGAAGTEFGGIDSGISGKPLSTELNVFAQLAWYF